MGCRELPLRVGILCDSRFPLNARKASGGGT